MEDILMEVRNLSFAYPHGDRVLNDISLQIRRGALITLLGPNGAGKSTLLNCMMGFLKPQSGECLLAGRNIFDMSYREISRMAAYVVQDPTVMFSHTVREYVTMGRAPYLGMFQRPSAQDYKRTQNVLDSMGIRKLEYKNYSRLSGGERQLVNVCRAIVQDPQLILFDEPMSALDYGNQIRVLRMIKQLSQQGYSIIVTTHNPDHPFLLNGTVCVLSREGKLRCGSCDEIMTEDYLNEVYQAKLKIRYFDEEDRKICITESL